MSKKYYGELELLVSDEVMKQSKHALIKTFLKTLFTLVSFFLPFYHVKMSQEDRHQIC